MRSLLRFALVPAAVLAVAGAWFAGSTAEAATAPSDISGFYAGKLKSRSTPLSTDKPDGGSDVVTLQISQDGDALQATLTVIDEDEGNQVFNFTGLTGNGRFWLFSNGEGETVLLTGSAKGKSPKLKIKAAGTFVDDSEFSTLKISVKEVDVQ